MRLKKMLITGATGMLGHQAALFFRQYYEISALSKEMLDITNPIAVKTVFDSIKPDIVINCAVLRNEKCQADHIKAYDINTVGTYYLAVACKIHNSVLVHISTDYIFDGQKNNYYSENDQPNPTGIYGRSKYEGERLAMQVSDKAFILRTAWLFGKYGDNFVHKIINAAKENNELYVVNDQMGSPTSVTELIKIIDLIVKTEQYGICHAVCGGQASRYEFAKKIVEIMELNCRVKAVKTKGISEPQNTSLSNRKIYDCFGYKPIHWTEALENYLRYEVKYEDII